MPDALCGELERAMSALWIRSEHGIPRIQFPVARVMMVMRLRFTRGLFGFVRSAREMHYLKSVELISTLIHIQRDLTLTRWPLGVVWGSRRRLTESSTGRGRVDDDDRSTRGVAHVIEHDRFRL
jgi:hypothetical protein